MFSYVLQNYSNKLFLFNKSFFFAYKVLNNNFYFYLYYSKLNITKVFLGIKFCSLIIKNYKFYYNINKMINYLNSLFYLDTKKFKYNFFKSLFHYLLCKLDFLFYGGKQYTILPVAYYNKVSLILVKFSKKKLRQFSIFLLFTLLRIFPYLINEKVKFPNFILICNLLILNSLLHKYFFKLITY